jgi:hypothetical protein
MNIFVSILLVVGLFFISDSSAQQLTLPQSSQKASVSQTIGLTDISISYHRPGVKGREEKYGESLYLTEKSGGQVQMKTQPFHFPMK